MFFEIDKSFIKINCIEFITRREETYFLKIYLIFIKKSRCDLNLVVWWNKKKIIKINCEEFITPLHELTYFLKFILN